MARKTRLIALDVSQVSFLDDCHARVFHGVMRYAATKPAWEMIFNVPPLYPLGTFDSIERLQEMGVDGLIACSLSGKVEAMVRAIRLPAVRIGRLSGPQLFPLVTWDNAEVGRMAARHFLDRGFASLAFCGPSDTLFSVARLNAFEETALAAGRQCQSFLRRHNRFAFELPSASARVRGRTGGGVAAAMPELAAWIADLPKPVGIMGANDFLARELLDVCRSLRLNVPAEVAIIGVDNSRVLCDTCSPSISSVDLNAERIGFEAARLLDRLISGKRPPKRPLIVPPLGVATRMSSDILAVQNPTVAKAVAFIRDRFAQRISLADIARHCGVSPTVLKTRFRACLGRTIHSEIQRQRLAQARDLLARTELAVGQIAEACGFSVSHLTHLFTGTAGMAPAAWRLKHKMVR